MIYNYRDNGTKADIIVHSQMAIVFFDYLYQGIGKLSEFKNYSSIDWMIAYPSYPGWHFLVYICYKLCLNILPETGSQDILDMTASLVNSLCIVLTWGIVLKFLFPAIKNRYSLIVGWLAATALIFVGPLNASGILNYYYLGGYSGNLWHNPTYLIMRPCAVCVFYMYVKIFNENTKTLYYLFIAMLFALTALLKPNFYQSFLPGLVVYCIILFLFKRNTVILKKCLYVAATCIPVGIVAIIQAVTSFNLEGGGIGIQPLLVWRFFTEEWEISLIVSIVFPLCVYTISALKKRWSTEMTLSICMFLSAMFQYMFLYIKEAFYYGDFSWGFGLSIFICYIVAVRELLQYDNQGIGNIFLNTGCWIIFGIHVLCGVIWFINLADGTDLRAPLLF